jgi:hypothetical protein
MNSCIHYQIFSIFELFLISIAGYYLPIFFRSNDNTNVFETDIREVHLLNSQTNFRLMKVFSAGVIVGVALLHLLPDAQEVLSPITNFPRKLLIENNVKLKIFLNNDSIINYCEDT